MLVTVPSLCCHTATALPVGSEETDGKSPDPILYVSTNSASPQPIFAVYRFARMESRPPSDCCHTIIAFPRASIAARAFQALLRLGESRRVSTLQPEAGR